MIKRILAYLLIVLIVFLLVYFTHQFILESQQLKLSYSLINVYMFNAVASVLVYLCVELIADSLPNQAGYAFLACVFLKIGFFVLIFQAAVFPEIKLAFFQRISLMLPFGLFIIIEAIGLAKLLNSKNF